MSRESQEQERFEEEQRNRQREDLRLIIGLAVWALAVEIRQAKEEIMTALDDAVARIVTDVNNATDALTALKAEIANLGNAGADTTAIQGAAQKLEDALGNATTTVNSVPPADTTPPADQPTSDTNLTSGQGVAPQADLPG